MSYSILPTQYFEKEIKRLVKKFPSLKSEYKSLLSDLKINPKMGVSIGNDCYKIRIMIASKGKGKSSGGRIITYIYLQSETIYLLTIYDKSEKENITDKELKSWIKNLQ